MSGVRRCLLGAAVVVASWPVTAQVAAARVVTLASGDHAGIPSLAMSRGGAFAIAWQRELDAISIVRGSTSEPLRAVTPQRVKTADALNSLGVGIAETGRVAVHWLSFAPGDRHDLNVATAATAGGAFSPRLLIRSTALDTEEFSAGPLLDSHGRLLEPYVDETDDTSTLNLLREADDGSFPAATQIFADRSGASIFFVKAMLDSADRPVFAWSRGSVDTGEAVPAASRVETVRAAAFVRATDAAGDLRAPQLLREGCDLESLAVAPTGQAAVAMTCDAAHGFRIYVSQRAPGGPFQAPRRATGAGNDEFAPSLHIGANGRVWLTWLHGNGTVDDGVPITRAQVASAAAGRRFTTHRWRTRYEGNQIGPSLIEGARGQMYLAWERRRVYLRALRRGHVLGKVKTLTPSGTDYAAFATDARGHGIATWLLGTRVQARRFEL